MGGVENDYGDTSDSDPPIPSARRRSKLTTFHARGSRSLYQADYSGSTGDSKDDDGLDDAKSDSENVLTEDDDDDDENDDDNDNDEWATFSRDLREIETDGNIRRLYPPSLHADWFPPIQPCSEYEVLERMLAAEALKSGGTLLENHHEDEQDLHEYQEFILRDFVVYESVDIKNRLRGHMQSLHVVATEQKSKDFYLDGYLEHDGQRQYLERVPILFVNIGALQEPELHTTRDDIYIQSDLACRLGNQVGENIWYRLERPMEEYSELFEHFTWISDLMKHFVDFLTSRINADEDVYLQDFQTHFLQRLYTWHGNDPAFKRWHTLCGLTTDFRQHINRHALFLRNQVWSIKAAVHLCSLSIWWAIYPGNDFPSRVGPRNAEEHTLVTHNIMRGFLAAFPAWGPQHLDLLKTVEPAIWVEHVRRCRMRELGFPDKLGPGGHYHSARGIALTDDTLENVSCADSRPLIKIEDVIGKVVVLRRNTLDKSDPDSAYSYAYVRTAAIHKGQQRLFIVWVISPRQTMCYAQNTTNGKAQYGVGNELFFSDECCCKPVSLSSVVGVFEVSLFSDHAEATAIFFIREKYFESEKCFMTAKISDLRCLCCRVSADQQLSEPSSAAKKDPSNSPHQSQYPKLKGLSLFSGCGLLDRGLEDSEMIKIECAIDVDECAVQTSLANQALPKGEHLTESVNYVFELWRQGQRKQPVIDLIAAGNPCPPFSKLNKHRGSNRSQRMCSLLGSVLSYVEHFLPRYVVIENVPEMDTASPACAQAICCLVELGYQVRKTVLNAYEFEAPQSRKRLFIIAAAAGLPLPRDPRELASARPPVTVSEAIKGLATIDNDTTVNLVVPDHIPLKRLLPAFGSVNLRTLVQKIPTSPPAMNLYKTSRLGLLTPSETQWFLRQSDERRRKGSKALTRVNPCKPFPTVVTTVSEIDSRSGTVLHPFEDRVMSLQEYKIAQGFLEEDVAIGSLSEQLKQVGNAVARPVGAAIGQVIGESWRVALDKGLAVLDSMGQHGQDLREGENDIKSTRIAMSVPAGGDDTLSYALPIDEETTSKQAFQPPTIAVEDSNSNYEPYSHTSHNYSRLASPLSAAKSFGKELLNELQAAGRDRRLSPGDSRSPSQIRALRRQRIRSIRDSEDDESAEDEPKTPSAPPGHLDASPIQRLTIRRKRTRTIPDSGDDDSSTEEWNHLAIHATCRDADRSRVKKSTRAAETRAGFSNTADDPIVLVD